MCQLGNAKYIMQRILCNLDVHIKTMKTIQSLHVLFHFRFKKRRKQRKRAKVFALINDFIEL